MDKFFFAFGGQPNDGVPGESIIEISENVSIFNLRPDIGGLIEKDLHQVLLEKGLLYKLNPELTLHIPAYDKETPPLWGILVGHEKITSINQWLFLLELYSGHVFTPIFIRDRLGKEDNRHLYLPGMESFPGNQNHHEAWKDNKISLFLDKKFGDFIELIVPQIDTIDWDAESINRWILEGEDEKFRLQTALGLYQNLREYYHSKDLTYWIKEAGDISIILEILLSDRKINIEKTLRKRTKLLLGGSNKNTSDIINELYEKRSTFFHGSFFQEFKTQYTISHEERGIAIRNYDELKDIWEITAKWRNLLRRIIIIYILVYSNIQEGIFGKHKSVLSLLEEQEGKGIFVSKLIGCLSSFYNKSKTANLQLLQRLQKMKKEYHY